MTAVGAKVPPQLLRASTSCQLTDTCTATTVCALQQHAEQPPEHCVAAHGMMSDPGTCTSPRASLAQLGASPQLQAAVLRIMEGVCGTAAPSGSTANDPLQRKLQQAAHALPGAADALIPAANATDKDGDANLQRELQAARRRAGRLTRKNAKLEIMLADFEADARARTSNADASLQAAWTNAQTLQAQLEEMSKHLADAQARFEQAEQQVNVLRQSMQQTEIAAAMEVKVMPDMASATTLTEDNFSSSPANTCNGSNKQVCAGAWPVGTAPGQVWRSTGALCLPRRVCRARRWRACCASSAISLLSSAAAAHIIYIPLLLLNPQPKP
jgi:hypothetical protein